MSVIMLWWFNFLRQACIIYPKSLVFFLSSLVALFNNVLLDGNLISAFIKPKTSNSYLISEFLSLQNRLYILSMMAKYVNDSHFQLNMCCLWDSCFTTTYATRHIHNLVILFFVSFLTYMLWQLFCSFDWLWLIHDVSIKNELRE